MTVRDAAWAIAGWLSGLAGLRGYERRWLAKDLAAGLSVAAIALPVGIAYADLAGVPAVYGIYSAIFPLFAYALLGSSRQLIVGPDAATCIIVAASLAPLAGGDPQRYLALMAVLTVMTGLLYLLAGMARLGFLASFLSQPILTGYLNGVAIVILLGQLPKLLGYPTAAEEPLAKLAELVAQIERSHLPTLVLGFGLVGVLLLLRRAAPNVPAALVIVALGVVAVATLGLDAQGVAVTGPVPAGLPALGMPVLGPGDYRALLAPAAAIFLISFTGGLLTAQSFARRNRYPIDPNQELVALGASNLATGLVQGFVVTGADSRTAVNDSMGGRTQLVGVVAAAAMLLVLLLLTGPLALVPTAALAAVVLVSALMLFDISGLRALFRMSWREGCMSLLTTVGVLVLGVLPGVVLAIVLSLFWLLVIELRPRDAVLGRLPGLAGFHSLRDFPRAETVPGLLLYRFSANIVFFNVDYFCERVRRAVRRVRSPVVWVVIDLSPVNTVDATAVQRFDELRDELAAEGVVLSVARAKRHLRSAFNPSWVAARAEAAPTRMFPTLRAAVEAFEAEHGRRGEATEAAPSGNPPVNPRPASASGE